MRDRMALYVADTVNAMLAYWDKQLICRYANKSYSDWFGVLKEDMVNKMTLPELLGRELFEKNRPYITAALGGELQTFERDLRMPSGEVRNAIATYYPDIEDGVVLGIIVHVADVTPIRKMQAAEKRLFESRELFQQFMDHSPMPAWITDPDGIMEYINSAYLTFTHCPEDIIGKSVFDVFPRVPAEEFVRNNRIALQARVPVESIETFVDTTNTTRSFKVTKFPLLYKETAMIAGWAMDITAQVIAHENMLRFEQEKRKEVLRTVIETQEIEKERFSKKLHDQTAQTLTSCKLILEGLIEEGHTEPLLKLANLHLGTAIEDLKLTCNLLTPMTLLDLGLKEALKEIAMEIRERFKTGLRLSFIGGSFEDIATRDKLNIFRIINDVLEIICQYMHATAIELELRRTGVGVLLVVCYTGLGVADPTTLKELQSVNYRVEFCNGNIHWSDADGGRQQVLIEIR